LLRACLSGRPQSGKSTLAYNAAQRLFENFPDQVVLEMNGYSDSGKAKSLVTAVCDYMKTREEGVTESNCLPKFWNSFSADFPSLVIVEDVNDQQMQQIESLDLSFPSRALLIVTTRDSTVKSQAEQAGFLADWNVNHFDDEEGFAVFEAVRSSKKPDIPPDALRALIESNGLLGFFPSIGWVKHIAYHLMKYSSLDDMQKAISALKSESQEGSRSTMEPSKIMEWTLGRMRSLEREADLEALLTVVVFPGSFDVGLFRRSAGVEKWADASSRLASLEECGFLLRQYPQQAYDPETGDVKNDQTRWWMHPELRSVTRSVLNRDAVVAAMESQRQRKVADSVLGLAAALTKRETPPRTLAEGFALERDNLSFALNLSGSKFFSQDPNRFWRLFT